MNLYRRNETVQSIMKNFFESQSLSSEYEALIPSCNTNNEKIALVREWGVICPFCGKTLKTSATYKKHHLIYHSKENLPKFR